MNERRLILFAYDVVCDKRRAKLSRLLDDYADRIQGSVFEGRLTLEEAQNVFKWGSNILDEKEDSLRMYSVCDRCENQRKEFGVNKSADANKELYFIV